MKNAPTTNSNESALNEAKYTIGKLLERQDTTVRPDVLSYALEGTLLTDMDCVFGRPTTRLSAVIYALEVEYGWRFSRHDRVINTEDGRIAAIVVYSLPQETIEQTFKVGARAWIEEVKVECAKLKQCAAKRKENIAQVKASRAQLCKRDLRQLALWGEP